MELDWTRGDMNRELTSLTLGRRCVGGGGGGDDAAPPVRSSITLSLILLLIFVLNRENLQVQGFGDDRSRGRR